MSVKGSDMHGRRPGFTLLELLLSVAILATISLFTFVTFSAVTSAWRGGQRLTESLHHADYALEQVVMALRSAYFPFTGANSGYGFFLEDDGDGPGNWDEISWVKVGTALVGSESRLAGTPHRVELTHERFDGGEDALAIRAWRLLDEIEDFDSDDVEPVYLSRKLLGLNVRCQDPEDEDPEDIEWIDDWEDTNRIPSSVEITLYMAAAGEDRSVEVKRIVEIPVAALAWGNLISLPTVTTNGGAP